MLAEKLRYRIIEAVQDLDIPKCKDVKELALRNNFTDIAKEAQKAIKHIKSIKQLCSDQLFQLP